MNLFRSSKDGSLDRQYLRICAVHKLMKSGRVSKERAISLLEQRSVVKSRQTVETWSFKEGN